MNGISGNLSKFFRFALLLLCCLVFYFPATADAVTRPVLSGAALKAAATSAQMSQIRDYWWVKGAFLQASSNQMTNRLNMVSGIHDCIGSVMEAITLGRDLGNVLNLDAATTKMLFDDRKLDIFASMFMDAKWDSIVRINMAAVTRVDTAKRMLLAGLLWKSMSQKWSCVQTYDDLWGGGAAGSASTLNNAMLNADPVVAADAVKNLLGDHPLFFTFVSIVWDGITTDEMMAIIADLQKTGSLKKSLSVIKNGLTKGGAKINHLDYVFKALGIVNDLASASIVTSNTIDLNSRILATAFLDQYFAGYIGDAIAFKSDLGIVATSNIHQTFVAWTNSINQQSIDCSLPVDWSRTTEIIAQFSLCTRNYDIALVVSSIRQMMTAHVALAFELEYRNDAGLVQSNLYAGTPSSLHFRLNPLLEYDYDVASLSLKQTLPQGTVVTPLNYVSSVIGNSAASNASSLGVGAPLATANPGPLPMEITWSLNQRGGSLVGPVTNTGSDLVLIPQSATVTVNPFTLSGVSVNGDQVSLTFLRPATAITYTVNSGSATLDWTNAEAKACIVDRYKVIQGNCATVTVDTATITLTATLQSASALLMQSGVLGTYTLSLDVSHPWLEAGFVHADQQVIPTYSDLSNKPLTGFPYLELTVADMAAAGFDSADNSFSASPGDTITLHARNTPTLADFSALTGPVWVILRQTAGGACPLIAGLTNSGGYCFVIGTVTTDGGIQFTLPQFTGAPGRFSLAAISERNADGTAKTPISPWSVVKVGEAGITTTGGTGLHSAKFAYVANANTHDVSVYSIDPITGALTNIGLPVPTASGQPWFVTIDPSGRFVYVAANNGVLSVYTINQTTGSLTAGASVATTGGYPSVTIDPSGRFVYISVSNASAIFVYTIDQITGALTANSLVAAEKPRSVAIHPSGRFAYVANVLGTISVYSMDQVTGALTVIGTPLATGNGPESVVIDPTGRFAYVANFGSIDVSIYTIDQATGALTAGTPVAAGVNSTAVAVDPTGKFVYVTNASSNNVSVYKIDQATGALTAGSPVAAGISPYSIAIDPSGKFAYVANTGSGVLAYTIDQVTGVLSTRAMIPAGGVAPISIAVTSGAAAPFTVPTDMVAYYCFDDPANIGKDCSANANNGIATGGVSAVPGVLNGAALFGGTSNPGVIHVLNSASLQFGTTSTLSYYIKIDNPTSMDGWGAISPNGVHAVVAKSHDRIGLIWNTGIDATNKLWSSFGGFSGMNLITGTDVLNGWATGATGRWVHVVQVVDNVGVKTYMDSVLVWSQSGSVDFGVTNTQDMYIGKFSDSWYPLSGTLDELKIFNRALSAAEVQSLYVAGGGAIIPTPTVSYLSENLPDRSYQVGAATKTWAFKNGATAATGLKAVQVVGMTDAGLGIAQTEVLIGDVAANTNFTVSLPLIADHAGAAIKSSYWKLVDASGADVAISNSKTGQFWLKLRTNLAPSFSPLQLDSASAKVGEVVSMAILARDGDNDPLTITAISGSVINGIWSGSFATAGVQIVTITLSDGIETASKDLYVVVRDPVGAASSFSDVTQNSLATACDPVNNPGGPALASDYADIEYLYLRGVVMGVSDGVNRKFEPCRYATQAEALKMLMTAARFKGSLVFDETMRPLNNLTIDNPAAGIFINASWAAPYVLKAETLRIIPAAETFDPQALATRTWLARAVKQLQSLVVPVDAFVAGTTSYQFPDQASFTTTLDYNDALAAAFFGYMGQLTQPFNPADAMIRADVARVASRILRAPHADDVVLASITPTAVAGRNLPAVTQGADFQVTGIMNLTADRILTTGATVMEDWITTPDTRVQATVIKVGQGIVAGGSNVLVNTLTTTPVTVGTLTPAITGTEVRNLLVILEDLDSGVRTVIRKDYAVLFPDRDGDGVRDELDLWPDNPLFSVDVNGNGIPDNADVAFNIANRMGSEIVVINGVSLTLTQANLNGQFVELAAILNPPVIGMAVAGSAQATVNFAPPPSFGGMVIDGYTVTSHPAGGMDTNAATTGLSHLITGLTNGTTYTFTVTAHSSAGESIPSAQSNAVTPMKDSQTISAITVSPTTLVIGGTATVSATATSGLYVSITSTTPTICTVTGGTTVTALTAGICTIAADQVGNANYNAAAQVTQSITITKLAQAIGAISFTPAMLAAGTTTTASAVATSGLAVTFNSTTPAVCMVAGNVVTAVVAGTCTITADQAGNATYSVAPQVTANLTITAASTPLNLIAGWNLKGNSVNAPMDVATTFGNVANVTTVWKWVPATSRWAFYAPSMTAAALTTYAAGKGYDVLATINGGEGFWVNAKAVFAVPLTAGTAVSSTAFANQLVPPNKLPLGWSLIATGDNPTPRSFVNALAVTPPIAPAVSATSLTTLWAWDSALSNWYFYAPSLDNNGTLPTYITTKGYLNFGVKTLDPTMGFWVNHP